MEKSKINFILDHSLFIKSLFFIKSNFFSNPFFISYNIYKVDYNNHHKHFNDSFFVRNVELISSLKKIWWSYVQT